METDCHLSGIEIRVHFHHPTSGALYIKDHSMSCFSKFEKSHEVRLKFPMPSSTDSNPDCAGVELAPNVWSFVVVLQKNNIGITSLMTGSDRVFNVTCDFNNVLLSSDSDKDVVNEKLVFRCHINNTNFSTINKSMKSLRLSTNFMQREI